MGDATHIWEKEDLLKHKLKWRPKTSTGKKGVQAHARKRNAGKI